MRIRTSFLLLALAAGCATAESRSHDVAAAYAASALEAQKSLPAGQAAFERAEASESEAVKEFPEVGTSPDVKRARKHAQAQLRDAAKKARGGKAREELEQIRAEIAAGRADAALAQRWEALSADARQGGFKKEFYEVGAELAAARSEKECAPKLDALLSEKKLKEARDLVYSEGSVCLPELRLKAAQPWLRSLADGPDACLAAEETLTLGTSYGENPLDTALGADPAPRIAQALVAEMKAGRRPACVDGLIARLDKGTFGPRVKSGFAPLRAAVEAQAQAERNAAAQKAADERAAALSAARAQVARLEKAGKYDDARQVAQDAKDDETVLRLNREHPSALVKRLREEMLRLKDKSPYAAALLQAVAKGYGDQEATLAVADLAKLHPAAPQPRKAAGFAFRLAGSACPDLKEFLGNTLDTYLVGREGGWVIKEAACGREGSPRAVHSVGKRYETRKESRQVPSGDGITTRTVFVDVPYEVTTESTWTETAHGNYWLSMRVAPHDLPDAEVVVSASAAEPGEGWNGVRGKLRDELYLRWNESEKAHVELEKHRRLQAALDRLSKATAPDDRADAMAELESVEAGSDKAVLQWFAEQFKLPAPVPWPW